MATRFTHRSPKLSIQKIAGIASATAIALSTGSFLIEFLPNSYYLDKYRKIFALYSLGEETPLPDNLLGLFNNVLDDLKITESERKNIKPFYVTGFNVFHAGLADTKTGAIIGIPKNFTYKDKYAIDCSEIRVGRNAEALNAYHPDADDLLDSLILSEKAKKFGVAREIIMSQKHLPLYRSIESAAMVVLTALATEAVRVQWGLAHKPRAMTWFVYAGSGLLGICTWAQIRDLMYTNSEVKVDEQLAQLGPDYVEGGLEFYEKQIKKNIALRSLMGPDGPKTFNRHGDEIFFFRQKRTPVTHRKRFFQEHALQKIESTPSVTQ